MIKLVRTNYLNSDFKKLVVLLDEYLKTQDGDQHDFYNQFNKIDGLKNVVVAYENEVPMGCGAFKFHPNKTVEIKRMFVSIEGRRKGIASKILVELETWASELKQEKCILETGKKQPEAVELYKNCGYSVTDNFGFYENIENSVCFEKILHQK